MRISILTPFGSTNPESGLVYLLANYLKVAGAEAVQLRCNGAFSVCDRDADSSWNRNVRSCFACMHDQKSLSSWANLPEENIASYLLPEEIEETRRWIVTQSGSNLLSSNYRGVEVLKLCQGTFSNRFGSAQPDLKNRNHEQFLRRVMLASIRMYLAARRYLAKTSPDLTLVVGGNDFISRAFLYQAKTTERAAALFRWDFTERAVRVFHPNTNEVLASGLIVEKLSTMRADPKTWPVEINQSLEEIIQFLGIALEGKALAVG